MEELKVFENAEFGSVRTTTVNGEIMFVGKDAVSSTHLEIPIDVPQDRDGDFEPQIVPKRKKDISAIEQKTVSYTHL